MFSEGEVTERMAGYLEHEYDAPIEVGEIECTLRPDMPNWTADIVVGDLPPYLLAVECKGASRGTRRYRTGIGQALSYAVFNRQAGVAFVDPSETVREMVEMIPIHGWSVTPEGVEHFSTNVGETEKSAVYY
jgi:hypothetical protein